jgi:hypothetical protein
MSILRRHLLLAQQAGGGGPQFVGAAPATQVPADGNSLVVNIGSAISGIQNGDFVVAVWASDTATGDQLGFNTGPGLVGEPPSLPFSAGAASNPGHFVKGWTYSTASPSISVLNQASGSAAREGVLLFAAFRNVQAPTASQVARFSQDGAADPPPLSGVSSGSIVLAIGLLDDDASTFSIFSGYTIATQGASAAIGTRGDAASAAIAYQTSAVSGTVDPPQFFGASDETYAYTIELRAAP